MVWNMPNLRNVAGVSNPNGYGLNGNYANLFSNRQNIAGNIYLSVSPNNAAYMFFNCTNIVEIHGVTVGARTSNAYYMFGGCQKIEYFGCSFDVGGDKVNGVTTYRTDVANAAYMFQNCRALLEFPVVNIWNTSSNNYNINCIYMFMNCTNVIFSEKLNINLICVNNALGMFINCYNMIDMPNMPVAYSRLVNTYQMFSNCTNLGRINFINMYTWTTNALLTNAAMLYMFNNCYRMYGNPFPIWPSTKPLATDPGSRCYSFLNCTNLTDYALIHTNWK
jgi:hypothetical protein